MTAEPTDNAGLDALTAALRSLGQATLPAGFDDTVATFDDMMAAIDAMPQEAKDDLADETEAHNLGADAFALAVAFLERGDFDRAEHWFRCAERYHVPQAPARLSDLTELRETLAGLVHPGLPHTVEPSDCGRDAALWSDDSWLLFQTKHHVADVDPHAQARQIIADAEREAASILVKAKMQAARTAVTPRATPTIPSFTVDHVFPRAIDAGPGQDPLPLTIDVLPNLTAHRGVFVFMYTEESGKAAALSELLTDAHATNLGLFGREGASIPLLSRTLELERSFWSARLANENGAPAGSCRRSPRVQPVHTWDIDVFEEAIREAACNPRLRQHIRNLTVHGLGACGSRLIEALSSSMNRRIVVDGGLVNSDNLVVIFQDEIRRHDIEADATPKRLVVAG